MIVKPRDPTLVRELLTYLRSSGCIAYVVESGDGVKAIAPHAFGDKEAAHLRQLVERWSASRPEAELELID